MYLSLPSPNLEALFGVWINKLRFLLLDDVGYNSYEISAKYCLYGPASPITCSPLNITSKLINGSDPYGLRGLKRVDGISLSYS
jgi:hypothetical protein